MTAPRTGEGSALASVRTRWSRIRAALDEGVPMTAVAAYLAEKLRHKESTVYRALVHMRSAEKRRVVLPEERQILDRILVDDPRAIPATITVPPQQSAKTPQPPPPGQPQPPDQSHAHNTAGGTGKTRRTDLLD